jgi:hypothetical protein
MTAQFAETEKAIQRIERIGIGRTVEPFASPQIDDGPVHREEPPRTLERSLWDVSADVDRRSGHSAPSERETRADQVLLARASVLLDRLMNAARTNAPMLAPWIAKAAVTVLVVVAAFSVGSLMRTGGDVAPGKAATPIATSEEASAPVAPTVDEEIVARPTTLLTSTEPRSARESESAAPQLRSPNQEATTTRPARYVGTLSITSVPSGAKVSINGKPAGVTPLRLSGQRAGSLAVQIAHDGFERWSAAVLVPADRLTQVSARLRATPR